MFQNATVSSRSSSSRSGNSCGRNSSMPSLRLQQSPLTPKTRVNPLFRHSDQLTSFDASQFIFQDQKRDRKVTHRKHAILRRFNSHDSHANFNELVSIDDSNTPESTNSRSDSRTTPETSPDNTGERSRHQEYDARDFLERFSLPRVVRVENGEPLLLYRCFDSFTKIQAKGFVGKKGKEQPDVNDLFFPEGYSGWFSLTNEKGEKSAITHSSILQLVREQVCSFLSLHPFTAYAGHNPDLTEMPGKVQYLKTQVKGGQMFQLRAVFQHKDRLEGGRHHSTKSSYVSRSARDKDLANRYAQLISQTNQEFYVPLTTKGEFYEIHSSMKARLCFQGLLERTGPLALDKDCLYKITHLLRRVALPVRVKLLMGSLPTGLPKDFSDTFILEKKIQEPLMVTCTLCSPSDNVQHQISCINLNSSIRISRSMLGFDSENRLFKSHRLQAALAFCHKNVESWYREVRIAPNLLLSNNEQFNRPRITKYECTECRWCNKLCPDHDQKRYSEVHEVRQKQLITKEVIEKFPKSKKWYRHLIKLGMKSESPFDMYVNTDESLDGVEKIKSIERYKDMSRLIEERFGKRSYNPVKKSASFMFSTKPINLEETPTEPKNSPTLLKCQSLDTQLYTVDESKQQFKNFERRNSKSNISDNISFDFQMCLLENENSIVEEKDLNLFKTEDQSLKDLRSKPRSLTEIDLNEIKLVDEAKPLKKSKPDLIPTLPKDDNSYITDRLCSEFHVKTKIQKRFPSKHNMLSERTRSSIRSIDIKSQSISIVDDTKNEHPHNPTLKSVVVQVHHEVSKTRMLKKLKLPDIDDIPYSKVADEIKERPPQKKIMDENIYSEICENANDNCDTKKICQCKRTKGSSEYCYVKLGSNGDSVTQSDSDETIYNTLR